MNTELIAQVAAVAGWVHGTSETDIDQYTKTTGEHTPFPVDMVMYVQEYGANMFLITSDTREHVPYATGLDTLQAIRHLTSVT